MKSIAVLGIVLIVLGVAALAYQGIPYTSRETIVDLGPLHATAEREKTLPLPPVLGIATLAGGIVLLVAGVRRARTTYIADACLVGPDGMASP